MDWFERSLCLSLDTCKLCKDKWSRNKEFWAVNYPWLVSNHIYLDPSLRENDSLDDVVKDLFDEYSKDSTMELSMETWKTKRRVCLLLNRFKLIVTDVNGSYFKDTIQEKKMMILKRTN